MDFVFEQVQTGGDRNLGYLLGDRRKGVALLIDPSYSPEKLISRANAQKMQVSYVINTHGHYDHTEGNPYVKRTCGALIAAHPSSSQEPDIALEEGSALRVGSIELKILHVPGHCSDHIVIYEPKFRLAFTGDHLFVGKIGGTSGEANAKLQYDHLHRLLQELPLDTTVWPGHDVGCRCSSTLQLEAATNPFLLARDLPSFLRLKAEWSTFKREQGLA